MLKTKKFVWDESEPAIHYRPGTSDEAIIQEVLLDGKAYLLPKLEMISLIYDIGANIGVATILLAKCYPDATIHCFEPEPENYELLLRNVEHLGARVITQNAALASKAGEAILLPSTDSNNLGGFSIFSSQGVMTQGTHATTVIKASDYCREFGTPDLIKIDCEGAEFDILQDIDLSKVVWITGELHDQDSWCLLDLLSAQHEIQTSKLFGQRNWTFHAGRKLPLMGGPAN